MSAAVISTILVLGIWLFAIEIDRLRNQNKQLASQLASLSAKWDRYEYSIKRLEMDYERGQFVMCDTNREFGWRIYQASRLLGDRSNTDAIKDLLKETVSSS